MPDLFYMVGIAGAGKSSVAIRYALTRSAIIYSSDDIRGEIYGDESCQKNPGRVFDILHQRVCKALSGALMWSMMLPICLASAA